MRKFSILSSFFPKENPVAKPQATSLIPTIERENSLPKIQVTKLPNGIKILTESIVFPTSVYIGALYKSGTRNETIQTSGVLQTIFNIFPSLFTLEALKQLQSSSSEISLNYDQEIFCIKISSLSQDMNKNIKILSEILPENTYFSNDNSLIKQKLGKISEKNGQKPIDK